MTQNQTVVALLSRVSPVAPRMPLTNRRPRGEVRSTIGPAKKRRANIRLDV
jgi:hypothetical protein